jgi:hypothetical protein
MTDARGQFENPQEEDRSLLEAVARGLVKAKEIEKIQSVL